MGSCTQLLSQTFQRFVKVHFTLAKHSISSICIFIFIFNEIRGCVSSVSDFIQTKNRSVKRKIIVCFPVFILKWVI